MINRLGVILEGGIHFDIKHFGKPKTVLDVLDTGNLITTPELLKLQNLMPSWHSYTVQELEILLTNNGFKLKKIMAPGALSTALPNEMLIELFQRKGDYEEYLDFEERFDSQREVLGSGFLGAGGLALVAERN